ncbi:MAG: DUF3179 domain-containing protein [Aggregatilineales bacterium]
MQNFRQKFLLPVLSLLIVGVIGVVLLTGNSDISNAQLSCDDPFNGERAPFSVSGWETDFCQTTIEFSEVLSGGVPRDGIPPIDAPVFDPIEVATWLQPQSPVVVVEMGEEARAYPLAILTRHEIVNDVIDGVPVAVTFCPLCNSAMVFDRRVDDQTLRFGVSGNLRNSDLIMWDDVTQSWWQQLTGEGIVGDYAGRQLTILPSLVVGFGEFQQMHPDGQVLSPTTTGRTYGNNPYAGYESRDPRNFLYRGELDERLNPTERVLAGIIDGEPMAYAFSALAEVHVINDTLGERDVLAMWQPGAVSALDNQIIDLSVDVGMAALYDRELDGQTLTFVYEADTEEIRDEQTGSVWNVFGEAVSGELAGSRLRQIIASPHYWFAWAAFHPETPLYVLESTDEE